MQKISDNTLKNIVFQHQMRTLAGGVIIKHVDDRYSLKAHTPFVYRTSQQIFLHSSRTLMRYIVDYKRIKEGQIRLRLKELMLKGELQTTEKNSYSTFMIDNAVTRNAYMYARTYWKKQGLDVGKPAKLKNFDQLKAHLESVLMHQFFL